MADEQIDDIHKHVVPYVKREYPKHLHKAGGKHVVVQDEGEEKIQKAKGWLDAPPVEETQSDEDDGEGQAAAAEKPAKPPKPPKPPKS